MQAFNEQDVEGFVGALDPRIEIEFYGGFEDVLGARFEGEEGARRFFDDWFAAFETMHVELERFLEAGERLVILHRLVGTGKESGAPVELPGAAIYGFRGDRISGAAFYYERDQALAAAGLSPSRAAPRPRTRRADRSRPRAGGCRPAAM